jgi:hypothetical protein
MKKPKRPRDTNELAKAIVDLATGEATKKKEFTSMEDYASALARKGG